MTEQWQDQEDNLRRYDREQADLERQADALVLKALTSLVSAAEDLKARLRRDTDGLLEEYRRTKRGLENELSIAGAERQRQRQETDDERDRIRSDARETAEAIVREAEDERESLLGEVREMEQRLRALEAQILQVLGAARGAGADQAQATEAPYEERPGLAPLDRPMPIATTTPARFSSALASATSMPPASSTLAPLSAPPMVSSTPSRSESVDEETALLPPVVDDEDEPIASDFEVGTAHLAEPEPADRLDDSADHSGREPLSQEQPWPAESARPSDADAAPMAAPPVAAPPLGLIGEVSQAANPDEDADAPRTTSSSSASELATPSTAAPASALTAGSAPLSTAPTTFPPADASAVDSGQVTTSVPPVAADAPDADTTDEAAPAARRGLQLVFDGVPGYQQAASIERAVGDLAEDGDVEIIEFEQGQLVLQVQGIDPRALADRLVAKPPLPMRLVASGQDNATFQLTPS